jgi:diguanylate cyclase (GGDEF)-like protein
VSRKLGFRLRELGALHANVRLVFILLLVLTVAILTLVGVKAFVLCERVTLLELASLGLFALACLALCSSQLRCLRRMSGDACLELERLTLLDDHTGVYNYRYLRERLGEELRRSRGGRRPLSVIFFDVDNFKLINDRLGHQAGNVALRRIAETIRASARGDDFVGRIGGDEFLVVLPRTDRAGATAIANRIRASLDALEIMPSDDAPIHRIAFSMGIANCPADATTQDGLVRAADEAMYRDKQRSHPPAAPSPVAS